MLRLRRFPIDTYNEAVAYLPRRSAIYRPEEFQALAKVEIVGQGRRIVAVVNVIDHPDLLTPDQIALSEQGSAGSRSIASMQDCRSISNSRWSVRSKTARSHSMLYSNRVVPASLRSDLVVVPLIV